MLEIERENTKTIFWNVDTQYDFVKEYGALSVPGAEGIEKNLETLTKYATMNGVQVVNTKDWHNKDTEEFSKNPDYVNSFPEHCMEKTRGAEYVDATKPQGHVYDIDWKAESIDLDSVKNTRNLVIKKDNFDVFKGNPHTDDIVDIIDPDRAIVYGVATNFCVDFAVTGLLERGIEVYVVKDAIKEIPLDGEPQNTYNKWEQGGAKLIILDDVKKYA